LITFDGVQIKACLDEYATGSHIPTKFDADIYSKFYDMIIINIEAVLKNEYHGHQLQADLRRWGQTAR